VPAYPRSKSELESQALRTNATAPRCAEALFAVRLRQTQSERHECCCQRVGQRGRLVNKAPHVERVSKLAGEIEAQGDKISSARKQGQNGIGSFHEHAKLEDNAARRAKYQSTLIEQRAMTESLLPCTHFSSFFFFFYFKWCSRANPGDIYIISTTRRRWMSSLRVSRPPLPHVRSTLTRTRSFPRTTFAFFAVSDPRPRWCSTDCRC